MNTQQKIFEDTQKSLTSLSIRVSNIDSTRPWGGFFVIDENDATAFINNFFPEVDKDELQKGKLSPKILFVAPEKKLSWQYHHRRAEIWKLIKGEAAIIRSETDEEGPVTTLVVGETIRLKQGERHRLIGKEGWGVVAEIWIHTDPGFPSDEEDIIRINDDFGRK